MLKKLLTFIFAVSLTIGLSSSLFAGAELDSEIENISGPREIFVEENQWVQEILTYSLKGNPPLLLRIDDVEGYFRLSYQIGKVPAEDKWLGQWAFSRLGFGKVNGTRFLIDDFNFDGQLDIAASASSGYGGTNVFYEVFLGDAKNKSLVKASIEFANRPQLHPDTNEVSFEFTSGPDRVKTIYKVEGFEFVEVSRASILD